MLESQIEVGHKYAMRVKVSAGEPLLQVQVLEKTGRRGQVNVRRLDAPHAGLEEFVKTRQLIVPWGERQVFLKDEELAQRFDAARPRANQALAGAISVLMASTGYSDGAADESAKARPHNLVEPVESASVRTVVCRRPHRLSLTAC